MISNQSISLKLEAKELSLRSDQKLMAKSMLEKDSNFRLALHLLTELFNLRPKEKSRC
jgi:hypothetical protein